MGRFLRVFVVCIIVLMFCVTSAIAEEQKEGNEKAKKEVTLEEIKVEATPIVSGLPLEQAASVGSGLNLTLRETPASVDIITKEVMRERGNTTALHALENAAGIAISPSQADEYGMAKIKLWRQGKWFIHTIHMIPSNRGDEIDWESFWTTFTFEVRG